MIENKSFTPGDVAAWNRSRHEERTYIDESTSKADAVCRDCRHPFRSDTAVAGDFGLCDLCYYGD
jgi:hypothetical protein